MPCRLSSVREVTPGVVVDMPTPVLCEDWLRFYCDVLSLERVEFRRGFDGGEKTMLTPIEFILKPRYLRRFTKKKPPCWNNKFKGNHLFIGLKEETSRDGNLATAFITFSIVFLTSFRFLLMGFNLLRKIHIFRFEGDTNLLSRELFMEGSLKIFFNGVKSFSINTAPRKLVKQFSKPIYP